MRGAECLLRTLVANGVDTCFMNPGTSEMQFVSALDQVPAMRALLCLFEGVCSGAADGYARMLRRPAATLLHLGPGLGNGLANFHNARKAHSPIVSIVGQHTTQHLRFDAPLSADIEAFARTVSEHVRTVARAEDLGGDAAAAVAAACDPPGQVATLIVPADFSWSEAGPPGGLAPRARFAGPDRCLVREIASLVHRGGSVGLLLGGSTLLDRGLETAGRLAAATGVRVFASRYGARLACGGGRFAPLRLPYFPEAAASALAGLEHLVLVECNAPVSFFGYPGRPSSLVPEGCAVHMLAPAEADGAQALAALLEECGRGPGAHDPQPKGSPPELTSGVELTPDAVGRTLARFLPDDAIVSEELVSSGAAVLRHLEAAPHFDLLPVTGGSIGQALPVAVGAAVACPGRKVIALEADGSSMYTPQSLWTMARERLDVMIVILANRRYRILDIEMERTGGSAGPRANEMLDLRHPELDWVKLSEGMGVEATRANTTDEFLAQWTEAMKRPGPRLIEAVTA
ncbi:MAG TPA: acetolactate synthase large subunit [Candidatus Acidoferrales bacterium]|nr:acetolactate synthase large subunit [Candidatus Acidoferrales bacterium]